MSAPYTISDIRHELWNILLSLKRKPTPGQETERHRGPRKRRKGERVFDAEHTEKVEAELDAFIERRAREARDAAVVEEAWRESERRERERRREAHRREWHDFHRHMERLHASLCEEHRAKAAELAGEQGAA